MFCNSCGSTLNGKVKFCGSCGASVGTAPSLPRRCPCGVELNPSMKFCVSCGRPSSLSQILPQHLRQAPQQVFQQTYAQTSPQHLNTTPQLNRQMPGGQSFIESKGSSSAGQKISLSAAIIGVICFFLPWVEVSCVSLRKSASGLQLATDLEITEIWAVLLVLLGAVALILFQLLARSINKELDKLLSLGVIGAGIVPLLILLYEYIRFSNEISKVKDSAPFGIGQILGGAIENSVSYQFGGILSVMVSVTVTLGGFFHLLAKRNQNPSG